MSSITVQELIDKLKQYPENAKVYMSSDSEGNGYGTIGENSIEFGELDQSLVLYPVRERLDYDDIFPKQYEKEYLEDERSID